MRERITIADLHNNQLVNRFHSFFFFLYFHWLKDPTGGQPGIFSSVREIVMKEPVSAWSQSVFLKMHIPPKTDGANTQRLRLYPEG